MDAGGRLDEASCSQGRDLPGDYAVGQVEVLSQTADPAPALFVQEGEDVEPRRIQERG